MQSLRLTFLSAAAFLCLSARAAQLVATDSPRFGNFTLFDGRSVPAIFVETNDSAAVLRAANDLAEDFARVTSIKPTVANQIASDRKIHILIGTLGQSRIIDQLSAEGKLETSGVSGQWESYVLQIVKNPLPNVSRALVIAGSDRRGTIFGIYHLSEMIGVSPWYWWADVPVPKKKTLALRGDIFKQGPPGVKYRGIFINDEDWGLNRWASKTFDPKFGNIGPKTYEKVFELLLRLRLNYIWPAMHPVSTSFGSVPENAALADKFGIVVGSSHCEPMLYNNVHWNEHKQGRWNYSLNRDAIHGIWEDTAKARGQYEAVWTIGIRGIHDAGMERPPNDMPGKINLMSQVFQDQRALLDQYVTRQFGPVAQCFVPYKEVLPIYDAGLKVPDDVTLVWVDDNFGYIRRLSNPVERVRSGGAGVYWHLSYYGSPHSYTWIDTTAPGLIWEELHKAWENDARNLWVINVGDIKPAEIGIDYFSQLAWNPDGFNLGGQREFLQRFAARTFGKKFAEPIADLLRKYYRLGTVRKPELMERSWALSLTPERAAQLESDYLDLLKRERSLFSAIPKPARAAYTELIDFPVHVVADTGLIFMDDRKVQLTNNAAANEKEIGRLRADLEEQVGNYNTNLVGGKWNLMMPGLVTGRYLRSWSSQVRWPWGERTAAHRQSSAA
ncbi:MAG TPA: glycosyl hydrolase 115 family protein, partial [Candidatus Angelobacter sp.]|nr:glycosyl hydrolase 115 family protein [Candidatus Angelobacter sp.]